MCSRNAMFALVLVAASAVAVSAQAVVTTQPITISAQLTPCSSLSIGDYAVRGNFTLLSALLDATDLFDALNGTRFTLFAPTDLAFENALELLDTTVADLLELGEELVTNLLQYHVSLMPANLTTLQSRPSTTLLTTVGANITVLNANGTLSVRAGDNTADVLDTEEAGEAIVQDTRCGVYVYPVDQVLLPRGATEALIALISGTPTPPAKAPMPAKAPAAGPAVATAGRR